VLGRLLEELLGSTTALSGVRLIELLEIVVRQIAAELRARGTGLQVRSIRLLIDSGRIEVLDPEFAFGLTEVLSPVQGGRLVWRPSIWLKLEDAH
jgi:hypothetical protein